MSLSSQHLPSQQNEEHLTTIGQTSYVPFARMSVRLPPKKTLHVSIILYAFPKNTPKVLSRWVFATPPFFRVSD